MPASQPGDGAAASRPGPPRRPLPSPGPEPLPYIPLAHRGLGPAAPLDGPARLTADAATCVTLMSSALEASGWAAAPAGGMAYDLRRTRGRWPAGWPRPRIVARPVGGVLWWHWAAPRPIAGVPIAPTSHCDRVLRLLCATLAKLAARADVDGTSAP